MTTDRGVRSELDPSFLPDPGVLTVPKAETPQTIALNAIQKIRNACVDLDNTVTFSVDDATLAKISVPLRHVFEVIQESIEAIDPDSCLDETTEADEEPPVEPWLIHESLNIWQVDPKGLADLLTDPKTIVTNVRWTFIKGKEAGPFTLDLDVQVDGSLRLWNVSDPGGDPDEYWNRNVEAVEANLIRNGIEWRKSIPRR